MVSLHHFRPRISIAASPDYNHRQKSPHNVLLSMRYGLTRDLPLKRSLAYYYSVSRRQQQLTSPISIATKSENLVDTSTEEKSKVEEDKKEASLPPLPEKPEPGDCCGSGCVRCVWDVYYEELEEHKQLSKSS